MKRAAHPVIELEDWLLAYLKHKLALGYIWLVQHKPARTALRVVVFNAPQPTAEAMMFSFNGVSFHTRFFGTVRQQHVEVAKPEAPAKSRIVAP